MQLSQGQKGRNWASNTQGTLYGENLGDSIIKKWTLNNSATEYIVYRSTSLTGPWEVNGLFSQAAARTGGATEELTSDARLMDVCYKVEAIDSKGVVIETYEPICVPKFVPTQSATNARGTLYGENTGDFIILQWSLNDSAAEYFVYRSMSLNGPWAQTGRFSQGAASTGGAKVDDTPDARLMDLCYKVEAIDSKGLVIEFHEPICVPKFAP